MNSILTEVRPSRLNKFLVTISLTVALATSAVTVVAASALIGSRAEAQSSSRGSQPLFSPSAIYVKDADGKITRTIYTEIAKSKVAKAPVVVLLNGLIYDITRWNPMSEQLAKSGVTVIRLSFAAQPESLLLLEQNGSPAFLKDGLELETLADDVSQVLNHHGVKSKVTVVGLSYGGTVATTFAKLNPKRVKDLVLLSPLVIPLDRYDTAGQSLRSYLDTVRFWENAPCLTYGWLNPWLCTTTDYWYDTFYNHFYENYLNVRVSRTPAGIDAAVYKKSVFHLVRATRDYDLRNEVKSLKNVHMVVSGSEEAKLKVDQLKAWSMIPAAERRSLAEFTGVVHALPDEAPSATAEWIKAIVDGDESLQSGAEYTVTP
jgi:pimeloyl-ACP methyl ester carboxylesterase